MRRARIWPALIVVVVAGLLIYWFVANRVEPSNNDQAGSAAPSVAQPASAGGPAPDTAGARASDETGEAEMQAPSELPPILRGTGLVPYRIGENGTFVVPAQHQFAGVRRVYTADSFDAWMAHYSAVDQKMIRAFNERNLGVYRDRTPQEIAWMAAHGYPMPEDLIVAQGMTTAKLQRLAKNGSTKAAFVLQNRVLTEISDKLTTQGYEYLGQVLTDYPQLYDAMDMASDIIEKSGSPYKAYVSARSALVRYREPQSRDKSILAALSWANVLGDHGARALIERFVHADPAREQIRRQLAGMAALMTGHFYDSLYRLSAAGCEGVVGARTGYNPTALPKL